MWGTQKSGRGGREKKRYLRHKGNVLGKVQRRGPERLMYLKISLLMGKDALQGN